MLEEKAKRLAEEAHKGQYRKDKVTPYIRHPEEVAQLLRGVGINDEDMICAAWLHDTIEDCGFSKQFLEQEFNLNIASLVDQLTRNCGREEYKQRILEGDYALQMVKLADVVHNCATLTQDLPEKTIAHKVDDCQSFYFDLSEKICPEFHSLLLEYLEPWIPEIKVYKIIKGGKVLSSRQPGTLAGYKRGKIFGRLDCKTGMRMKKENRVFFHTLEDAVLEGYRPCKNCKPINEQDFEKIKHLVPYKSLEEFYNRDHTNLYTS